jgi:hypothetical protein
MTLIEIHKILVTPGLNRTQINAAIVVTERIFEIDKPMLRQCRHTGQQEWQS